MASSPLGDQLPIERGKTGQCFCLREEFSLERLQARGQRRSALQVFLGTDEPKVLGEALSVVDILVARQPAIYRWCRLCSAGPVSHHSR